MKLYSQHCHNHPNSPFVSLYLGKNSEKQHFFIIVNFFQCWRVVQDRFSHTKCHNNCKKYLIALQPKKRHLFLCVDMNLFRI